MQKIRLATLEDTSAMLDIYKPYVEHSAISFEVVPPSLEEFRNRITKTLEKYPWLVCEVDNQVVGYAYATEYRSRKAYQWSVEATVYLHSGFHRRGLGRDLYKKLFELLKQQGFVNVIAGITQPNSASVCLHEALGFTPVGIFHDVGFKLGQWWDVGYWELQLQKPQQPVALHPPAQRL